MVGGVDGSLHLPVPFVNRLDKAEPATVSILPFWTFFISYFLFFKYNLSAYSEFFFYSTGDDLMIKKSSIIKKQYFSWRQIKGSIK
jgi:hypothetical protein